MLRSAIKKALPALGLVGLLANCEPAPVSHLSWTPLTEAEVQTRLAAPTGALFQVANQELMARVRDRMPTLLETARFLAQVVTVVANVAETDYSTQLAQLPEVEQGPSPTADTTWGSSIYLRLSCLGPEPLEAPVGDFSAGEVRLDSPELTSLSLASLIGGGEFLLSFRECQLGPLLLDASLPGRYMTDLSRLDDVGGADAPPLVGVALSTDTVDYQGNAGPLGLVAMGCGGGGSCSEDLRTVAELKTDAGTYLVSFRVLSSYWNQQEALSLSIRGRDSQVSCRYFHGEGYSNASLTCSPSQEDGNP